MEETFENREQIGIRATTSDCLPVIIATEEFLDDEPSTARATRGKSRRRRTDHATMDLQGRRIPPGITGRHRRLLKVGRALPSAEDGGRRGAR